MDRHLRIVFVLHSDGYVKMFEPALRLLAQRGHQVHLVPDRRLAEDSWALKLIDRLQADHPSITLEPLELGDDGEPWPRLFAQLSRSLDYVRYLEPRFSRADALRARARRGAPPFARRLAEGRVGQTNRGRHLLTATLRALLAATPASAAVTVWLEQRRPDVLLLSPVVDGRRQPEFVRAARELGIPCVACVRSWDNLSTKGAFVDPPDVVTVWNETQRREAVEMHGLPPERVVATGAQNFDVWFDRGPARPREPFLRELGLDPDHPYILYLCSSKFISGVDEPAWVARWMRQIRDDRDLEGIGVLVRPHPKSGPIWRDVRLEGNTTIYPPIGSETDTSEAQDLFFDSIYHAAAVVGVNTSALIESAIIGRPVLSVLAPEFKSSQEDSIHFEYLRQVGGGAIVVDESLEEHVKRLSRVVEGTEATADTRTFLHEFVRPHGLDRPAAPILAEVLEAAGRLEVTPLPAPASAFALRPLTWLLAHVLLRETKLTPQEAKVRKRRRAKRRRQQGQHARQLVLRHVKPASKRLLHLLGALSQTRERPQGGPEPSAKYRQRVRLEDR